MKKNRLLFSILLASFLSIFLLSPLYAQEEETTAERVIYRIQLGAYKNPTLHNFEQLYSLGAVYTEVLESGLSRILLGDFYSEEQGKKVLAKVQQKGYKQAFLRKNQVTIDIPADIAKANKKQPTTETPAKSKEPNNATIEKKKVTKPTPETPDKSPRVKVGYVIQLGAFKEADFGKFSNLDDFGELFVEKVGEFNRILLGIYDSEEEAQAILAALEPLGYKKVFVKKVTANTNL